MAKERMMPAEQIPKPSCTTAVVIAVMAHAPLASALEEVAEHVFGESVDITAIDVLPGACAADSTGALVTRLSELDRGAGVLLLTDLPGASPANICATSRSALLKKTIGCTVITGVNVSMLLRVLNYRHRPLDELAQQAIEGGRQTIARLT